MLDPYLSKNRLISERNLIERRFDSRLYTPVYGIQYMREIVYFLKLKTKHKHKQYIQQCANQWH